MMDPEQLEKQFSIWNKLLYAAFGSAITLLLSSFSEDLGVPWLVLQVLVTSAGFFLLWGKRWKALPFSKERSNTIFGYLFTSWLLLFVPSILGVDSLYYICISAYTIFLLVIYMRAQKRQLDSDEMFP
jgi:hypothetical protein